jgi:hypothetical protein
MADLGWTLNDFPFYKQGPFFPWFDPPTNQGNLTFLYFDARYPPRVDAAAKIEIWQRVF